jgi:hypothetical protein
MAAASNYTENLALKFLLTNTTATRPTAWYVALFTTNPTDAGSGTEVSGTNYARTAVTFTVTDGTATNSAAVTFTAAGSNWGTVSHIGVYDASTAGNLLFHGEVTTAKQIDSGDTFTISTNNLSIVLA